MIDWSTYAFFFSFLFLSHDFHFHINFCGSWMFTKYHLLYPLIMHFDALNKSTLYTFILLFLVLVILSQDSSLKVKTKLMLSVPPARDFIWKCLVLPLRRFSIIFSAMMRFSLSLSLTTAADNVLNVARARCWRCFFLSIFFGVADHWSGDVWRSSQTKVKKNYSRVTSEWVYGLVCCLLLRWFNFFIIIIFCRFC